MKPNESELIYQLQTDSFAFKIPCLCMVLFIWLKKIQYITL